MQKICNFVEWELEYFRQYCNFTDIELEYFNLRAKDKSNAYIAQQLHVSEPTVSLIAKRVKKKMIKVL